MPRTRHKPIHPFIQLLMDTKGCKTIQELAERTGISYTTLIDYADQGKNWSKYKALKTNAEKIGMSVDEFLDHLCSA